MQKPLLLSLPGVLFLLFLLWPLQSQADSQIFRPLAANQPNSFPYLWQLRGRLNLYSYRYINRRVTVTDNDTLAFAGLFTNAYADALRATGFRLSPAQQRQLEANRQALLRQEDEVVRHYQQLFGGLTPRQLRAAGAATRLDYVVDYQLGHWGCPKLSTAENARLALACLPAAASDLREALLVWWRLLRERDALLAPQWHARQMLAQLRHNLSASAIAGTVQTIDSRGRSQRLPGYRLLPAPVVLTRELSRHAPPLRLTVRLHADRYNEVEMSGGQANVAPGIAVLTELLARRNDVFAPTERAVPGVLTLAVAGCAILRIAPNSQPDGWYAASPIRQARSNRTSSDGGYYFVVDDPVLSRPLQRLAELLLCRLNEVAYAPTGAPERPPGLRHWRLPLGTGELPVPDIRKAAIVVAARVTAD